MKELFRGSSQGFGFAVGMLVGFGLVAFLSSKALDSKLKSMAGDLEDWVIDQADKQAARFAEQESVPPEKAG